jgi:hypothetical protein
MAPLVESLPDSGTTQSRKCTPEGARPANRFPKPSNSATLLDINNGTALALLSHKSWCLIEAICWFYFLKTRHQPFGGTMRTLRQDLRYNARILLKNPGFRLVAVLTLALSIDANTVTFGVVEGRKAGNTFSTQEANQGNDAELTGRASSESGPR